MYESRAQAPLTRRKFAARMIGHAAVVIGLLVFSLFLGMAGYVGFEKLSWADAFLNTAMLLGGMGPVNPPQTEAGKLFAGLCRMDRCFARPAGCPGSCAVTASPAAPLPLG